MAQRAYINIIRRYRQILVAACDAELLGTTLKHGKIKFEICPEFYGDSLLEVEEAIEIIKKATIANLIGSNIVERAIKEGLVHPQAILHISGIPHAQIMRY